MMYFCSPYGCLIKQTCLRLVCRKDLLACTWRRVTAACRWARCKAVPIQGAAASLLNSRIILWPDAMACTALHEGLPLLCKNAHAGGHPSSITHDGASYLSLPHLGVDAHG